MSIHTMVEKIRRSGVVLSVEKGRLFYRGPEESIHAALPDIRAYRDEIVAALLYRPTLPDSADYEERAAIREYDGGLPRPEAEQAAAQDCGFETPDALHRATVADWRGRISARAATAVSEREKRALAQLLAILDQWGLRAAAMGWDAVSLFGVDGGVVRPLQQRPDRHGVFIQAAVSMQPGLRIVALTANAATFETVTGAQQKARRFHHARDHAVPIWEARETPVSMLELCETFHSDELEKEYA